jgi:hypothetical protein
LEWFVPKYMSAKSASESEKFFVDPNPKKVFGSATLPCSSESSYCLYAKVVPGTNYRYRYVTVLVNITTGTGAVKNSSVPVPVQCDIPATTLGKIRHCESNIFKMLNLKSKLKKKPQQDPRKCLAIKWNRQNTLLRLSLSIYSIFYMGHDYVPDSDVSKIRNLPKAVRICTTDMRYGTGTDIM